MNTEQERADLLPCPFCGSTNIEIQISTPDREGVPTSLMCSDCGASGPWEYEQDNIHAKADAAWNRRAALQSQDRADAERRAEGERYVIVDDSQSGHCCFGYTVVDTAKPFLIHGEHYQGRFIAVCECFDEADAQLICDALNAHEARRAEGEGE